MPSALITIGTEDVGAGLFVRINGVRCGFNAVYCCQFGCHYASYEVLGSGDAAACINSCNSSQSITWCILSANGHCKYRIPYLVALPIRVVQER